MPVRRVAIVQSSYVPWKGYFDLIRAADDFVLFDDVQFTSRDWRNRNRIKTPQGLLWLTIPVRTAGHSRGLISEVMVDGQDWRERHWKTLARCYARAPHFPRYAPRLRELYLDSREQRLSCVNRIFLEALCELLGIRTRLHSSSDFVLTGGRSARLVDVCGQLQGTSYLSGPSARTYLEPGVFAAAGIEVEFADYSGYPEYDQLYPPFEHHVSVLDLLLMHGPDASRYMLRL